MRADLLRNFQLAAVFEVRGNSRCTERVAPDQGFYPRTTRAAPDHEVDLRLGDAPFRELLRLARRGKEQGSAFLAGDSSGLDVCRQMPPWTLRGCDASASRGASRPHAAVLEAPVFDVDARRLRRSARIDHFRSPKVTHTKNTICPDLPVGKQDNDIIHAEGVRFVVTSSARPGTL